MDWNLEETTVASQEWRQLLDRSDHLLFHEPIWDQVIQNGISSRTFAFVLRDGDTVKAGATGFILGNFGIRIAYCSYPYGSLIGEPPPASIFQELVDQFCRKRGVCQIQFIGFPDSPALECGSQLTVEDFSHTVNLAKESEESVWKSYRRSRRQDIRKTRERGVTVDVSSDLNDVRVVHGFYLQTMKRTGGVARYKRSLVESIVKNLSPLDRARLYVARFADQPIAGMLIVFSKKVAHGLLLASSDQGMKLQPNKLLLHTGTIDCIEKGIETFDYMPSGQSSKGVTNFKGLWNADRVGIEHHTFVVSPLRSFLWKFALNTDKQRPFRDIISWVRKSG